MPIPSNTLLFLNDCIKMLVCLLSLISYSAFLFNPGATPPLSHHHPKWRRQASICDVKLTLYIGYKMSSHFNYLISFLFPLRSDPAPAVSPLEVATSCTRKCATAAPSVSCSCATSSSMIRSWTSRIAPIPLTTS